MCLFQQKREDRVEGDVSSFSHVFYSSDFCFRFLANSLSYTFYCYRIRQKKSKTEIRRHETKVLVPGHWVDCRTGMDYTHNLWVIYTQCQAFDKSLLSCPWGREPWVTDRRGVIMTHGEPVCEQFVLLPTTLYVL